MFETDNCWGPPHIPLLGAPSRNESIWDKLPTSTGINWLYSRISEPPPTVASGKMRWKLEDYAILSYCCNGNCCWPKAVAVPNAAWRDVFLISVRWENHTAKIRSVITCILSSWWLRFQAIWKNIVFPSQIGIVSPIFGVNIRNIWNQHLAAAI